MDWLVARCISHRGLHSGDRDYPENSMRAFERSIQEGFPIELDVRLLAGGKVAIFHDSNTKRMTGTSRMISDLDSNQIRALRLLDSDQRIPLLEEVLELVKGKVPLLIDIKNSGRAGMLEETVKNKLLRYKGVYAVQSFNPYSLLWFKKNTPAIVRGQISGDFRDEELVFYKRFMLKNLMLNWLTEPYFISYDVRCLPHFAVSLQRKRGLPVLGWTVRSDEEYQRVKEYCDNIIFEGFIPL